MTPHLARQLARRVDAAAFGVVMLAFCWWLHTALGVLGWLCRQPSLPLPVVAVAALAVLLVALAVPTLVGRPVFRLLSAVMAGAVRLALSVAGRLPQRPASAAGRRPVSGDVR
jgi:hypothetical protein